MAPYFFDNVRRILSLAEWVSPGATFCIRRDPKDDKFLEGANLVTLDTFRGIPILAPAPFCRALAL
jgi:hypothetical protein